MLTLFTTWQIPLKQDVDRWSFDIFTLSFITNGHPMQALAYEIFKNYKLLPTFQLSEDTFMRFIIQVTVAVVLKYGQEN